MEFGVVSSSLRSFVLILLALGILSGCGGDSGSGDSVSPGDFVGSSGDDPFAPDTDVPEFVPPTATPIPAPKPGPQPVEGENYTFDLGGGLTVEMVWIPGGTFMMGGTEPHRPRYANTGPYPLHEVELDGFWIGRYEVTQAQFERLMGTNPSKFKGPDLPVDSVPREDAIRFASKLGGLAGWVCRPPTEAEWEYACRAGSADRFHFGNSALDLADYAWFEENSGGTTHPVGQKKPNPHGLYDMHGNVDEMCFDWYDQNYYSKSPRRNPMGAEEPRHRGFGLYSKPVRRGGSFGSDADECQTARRDLLQNIIDKDQSPFRRGFRVALEARALTEERIRKAEEAERAEREAALEMERRGTIDLGDGVTLKLVWVEPGSFSMGSGFGEVGRDNNEPSHQVYLEGYWIGRHEVTQEQYARVMGENPSGNVGPRHPVEQVTWDEAAEFCRRLSELTGRALRLPTEAEWEKACRAGQRSTFCFGDDHDQLGEYAWYQDNSGSETHPVGEKEPNAWGIYDMHGNVWEWCADWFVEGAYRMRSEETRPRNQVRQEVTRNPRGARSGPERVRRGGDYGSVAVRCRSAQRGADMPETRSGRLGFRVAEGVQGQEVLPRQLEPVSSEDARRLRSPFQTR